MDSQSYTDDNYLERGRDIWRCCLCNKNFQYRFMLKRHNLRHTDERQFQCHVCYKSFRLQATLTQHFSTHSSDKPFVCKICEKRFGRSSSLIAHFKTHDKEKPYKCHKCTKSFHQKGNLRNHLFSHTNERPYQCNDCCRGFNQQSNLIYHIKKKHPDTLANLCLKKNKSQQISDGENHFGFLIDAIRTEYMDLVLKSNAIPFAVLYIKNHIPCFVKLMTDNMPENKHMLLPVCSSDITSYSNVVQKENFSNGDDFYVQIPIVAIINFVGIVNKQYIFDVQPPHDVELSHYKI